LAHSDTYLTRDVVVALLSAPALNAEGADDTTTTLDDDKIVSSPAIDTSCEFAGYFSRVLLGQHPYRF